MGTEASEPVIELDDRGVALLRSWTHPCTHFGVVMQSDGLVILHPMSAPEADLWRSGLVGQIIDSFAHPERMIRAKPYPVRLLDFAPPAWKAYQSLGAHGADELGKRLKRALERITEDPGAVRADPGSRRFQIVEQRLQKGPPVARPPVWGLRVDAPDGTGWLIVWRELRHVIEVGHIGPAPGQANGGPACTSQGEREI